MDAGTGHGRQSDAQRLAGELFASGAAEPLYPLLHYTLAFAIREFFGGLYSHGQVIKLVAALRAEFSGTPADLVDPVAAESEVLRALGDTSVPPFPNGNARYGAGGAAVLHGTRHESRLRAHQRTASAST